MHTVSQDNRLGTAFIFNTGAFVVDPMPAATSGTPDPDELALRAAFPTLTWTPVVGATRYEVWAKPVATRPTR